MASPSYGKILLFVITSPQPINKAALAASSQHFELRYLGSDPIGHGTVVALRLGTYGLHRAIMSGT
jgi:hypothetical protein